VKRIERFVQAILVQPVPQNLSVLSRFGITCSRTGNSTFRGTTFRSPFKDRTCYKASEMSDGERAIFYMIGQTLAAAENSLLIFDEPELHVHRSIMDKLWDDLEAARQDCAFVFITHDLEHRTLK
jgi:ABC-type branched-subunit amino acid transport system ATPase component